MKKLLFPLVLFSLCVTITKAQTNANVPGPENVLVVYNLNSSVSDSVKNYYLAARNIPGVNVVELDSLK